MASPKPVNAPKNEYPSFNSGLVNVNSFKGKKALFEIVTQCDKTILPAWDRILEEQKQDPDLDPSVRKGWEETGASVREECQRIKAYRNRKNNSVEKPDIGYPMNAQKWVEMWDKNYAKFKTEVAKNKASNTPSPVNKVITANGTCCKCPGAPEPVSEAMPIPENLVKQPNASPSSNNDPTVPMNLNERRNRRANRKTRRSRKNRRRNTRKN